MNSTESVEIICKKCVFEPFTSCVIKQACYHSAMKTQVTVRIFKLVQFMLE